ncbi:MAG TPA: hypothetical protein VFA85_02520 [Terriglobales bacterium]|nr:hypothetical protein [Terriglobales bacterium]
MAEAKNFTSVEEVSIAISESLAEAPLYQELVYSDTSNAALLPASIQLFCENCDQRTNWQTTVYGNHNYREGFSNATYTCRNCGKKNVKYHYYWGDAKSGKLLFFKVGQWPSLEERIPRELQKNLDRGSLSLYYKALRSRNQGLGLGSLAYLRRVVEDKINSILDMIAEEAKGVGFAPEQVAKVEETKNKGLFKDKIDLAVNILPPSLRPGGHNPIDGLHDLVSDGIHRRSEEECIEIFDKVRFVFEYLFREIDARRRSAAEYAESVAKIASRRK